MEDCKFVTDFYTREKEFYRLHDEKKRLEDCLCLEEHKEKVFLIEKQLEKNKEHLKKVNDELKEFIKDRFETCVYSMKSKTYVHKFESDFKQKPPNPNINILKKQIGDKISHFANRGVFQIEQQSSSSTPKQKTRREQMYKFKIRQLEQKNNDLEKLRKQCQQKIDRLNNIFNRGQQSLKKVSEKNVLKRLNRGLEQLQNIKKDFMNDDAFTFELLGIRTFIDEFKASWNSEKDNQQRLEQFIDNFFQLLKSKEKKRIETNKKLIIDKKNGILRKEALIQNNNEIIEREKTYLRKYAVPNYLNKYAENILRELKELQSNYGNVRDYDVRMQSIMDTIFQRLLDTYNNERNQLISDLILEENLVTEELQNSRLQQGFGETCKPRITSIRQAYKFAFLNNTSVFNPSVQLRNANTQQIQHLVDPIDILNIIGDKHSIDKFSRFTQDTFRKSFTEPVAFVKNINDMVTCNKNMVYNMNHENQKTYITKRIACKVLDDLFVYKCIKLLVGILEKNEDFFTQNKNYAGLEKRIKTIQSINFS